MCRCAAALTAQQRSGFSDDRQVRRSAKFVWKRSLTAINALQKRFRRAKAMVVQSYKGNRLSILYLNRFGRLAHLRRARRRGCRSKAAFVPLREAQAMSPKSAVCFISLCGVGRAEMSVCIYRRPKSAVRRIDSRALPLICAHRTMCCRPSRNRGVEECAAAAGLSASAEAETQTCAARAPARRPLRESRTHRRFFSPVGAKAYPLLHRIWNTAMRAVSPKSRLRGRSLRLCAGRYGIACRRSARRRPTAKPKRPSRFRPNPLRVSAQRIGKRRGRKRRSGFRCERKNVCGAQPQTLIVHPFFSRRGRTEG